MTVPEAEWPAKPTAAFADLYELTMMQAYLREGLIAKSVSSLFPRRLPPTRNYLIACGLETVLEFLEQFHLDHRHFRLVQPKVTNVIVDSLWARDRTVNRCPLNLITRQTRSRSPA